MHRILHALTAVTALLAVPLTAQETPQHTRALVAGYKAAFTCSATFNAGKSADSVAELELRRIYPGYREILSGLHSAEIDRARKTVSVRYSDSMPPRSARGPGHAGIGSARAMAH